MVKALIILAVLSFLYSLFIIYIPSDQNKKSAAQRTEAFLFFSLGIFFLVAIVIYRIIAY